MENCADNACIRPYYFAVSPPPILLSVEQFSLEFENLVVGSNWAEGGRKEREKVDVDYFVYYFTVIPNQANN